MEPQTTDAQNHGACIRQRLTYMLQLKFRFELIHQRIGTPAHSQIQGA
jgi:hypothetical protein